MRPEIKSKIESSPPKQVDLEDMRISDEDIDEIAAFIVETKPKIEEIFLDDNLLTDNGAKVLAHRLAELQGLTTLSLQYNNIDQDGITAVYSLLEVNPKLSFSWCGNKMRDTKEIQDIRDSVLEKLKKTAPTEEIKEPTLSHPKKKKWWCFNR